MSTKDGCFTDPSYVTIGDPYRNGKLQQVHEIKGRKQFLTSGLKPGQTSSNWGPGPRSFVGLSGSYQERYKMEAQARLENTKKMIKPSGFTYSSHTKKSCGKGDYFGSFVDPKKNQEEEEKYPQPDPEKRVVVKPSERAFEKRNIITQPGKKGTLGYAGTLIGGKSMPAMSAEYDSERIMARKALDEHKAKLGERKSFKGVSYQLDFFDTYDHCASSKVYTRDDECKMRPPDPEDAMNPKERAIVHAANYRGWKPTHAGKDGEAGVFAKFPEQLPDPYDEKIVTRAMLPNRRNPVEIATKDLPASIRERRSFRPSNGPKTKYTTGTCLLGINKHNI